MYKSCVIDYGMRLLEGTEALLNFALIKDGEYVAYQVLLDVHRAKWHSFEAMLPYFKTHVQALVDEGICYFQATVELVPVSRSIELSISQS